MKTIFDRDTYQEIVRRLESLQPNAQRQWGKMSVAQMLEHNSRTIQMAMKRGGQQALAGKFVSWIFRNEFLGEKPFSKNAPTGPDFKVSGEPNFQATRDKVKALLRDLHAMGEAGCDGNVHRFFGRLSGAEWGITQYKHLDHHLRQFGA
jgi:uncharacterized protein DUF1569